MNAAYFLIDTIFNLYLMVVLLRLWLQLARADFYNPFSQFIVKATHPVLAPLRRLLPPIGSFDTASLVLALLVAATKIIVVNLVFYGGFPHPLGIVIQSGLTVFKEALQLLFWVLILRAILSWVSQGRSPVEYVLQQLTEPMLAPIRRVIPPIGGLDLSILVAIIGLQFFQLLLADIF